MTGAIAVVAPAPIPLLDVRDLAVSLAPGIDIVTGISFSVSAGEIVGLVGESGSGKTTIATALLGHARQGARVTDGEVWIGGREILALSPAERRMVRGPLVAHVAQDPATALNPMMRIGAHLDELLSLHAPDLDRAARRERIVQVAHDVGLPADEPFLKRFPHQLSGGQQQRVLLAMAFVLRPRLIVLDEPTTALDVTTQAKVLATIRRMCRDQGIAALYVSHDLAVVRDLVDRLVVLYAGRVAETARRDDLFRRPAHPYSRGLLSSVPDVAVRRPLAAIPGHAPAPAERAAGCAFAPRCDLATADCAVQPSLSAVAGEHRAACHHPVDSPLVLPAASPPSAERDAIDAPLLSIGGATAYYGSQQILFGADLELWRGECTALVGESGSGKTTLARAIVGFGEAIDGRLLFDGIERALDTGTRSRDLRRRIQYIFQNPYRALNPRERVGQILGRTARHFFAVSAREAERRVAAALDRVALPATVAARYPGELSGGERQRVAIARALICEPEILICDEVTSALDVSVQAAILDLLAGLAREGLTLLFVTHDLAVVRAIADRVVVLRAGHIVEQGSVDAVLDRPTDNYTRALVADSPSLWTPAVSQPSLVLA